MTKVKICGLSTQAAVEQAVKSGADYIGFVFAKSKRQVGIKQANYLAQFIPETVQKVGVFVSPTLVELQEAITKVPLDFVQIHGDFEEELFKKIDVPNIRAIPVQKALEEIDSQADYLLFDAPLAGSGKIFNWELLKDKKITKPYFLAGGLTVDNVQQAITFFHPYAVDVSSGVETDGEKDLLKIAKFIESVKK
ncbi:phosphoribosylanthranilate isomerase [Streptococcus macedonicus]|uniref:N-(5'-phosphoribosyl)anthranilate isomerase n=1 Tax=Streptococcus macedonicus TaxID=59310 RepID=A0AA47IMP3_STRMC|nr:phosphoribosylanthranilate isomerase [Streptococcus macedonicus]CCF01830.1 Phosphoribosylanthranilate isomerase [Streptococcus macedonicus ACA-DC 198]MCW8485324.1 phosphoribosylanthranilate isomerase [Streptococcus macedonicus]MCW8493546.1 phosphoribosylanthranilate isomerase [Streptococcus macedonicus]MCW8498799.1 phosphoribosylanthranilate isomerase [Streptococcus macedonicus]MCW8500981.1 phosphoribosylanthranilate isomerase [Streptococcus macedonicus]